jgi:hypothetical protein
VKSQFALGWKINDVGCFSTDFCNLASVHRDDILAQ